MSSDPKPNEGPHPIARRLACAALELDRRVGLALTSALLAFAILVSVAGALPCALGLSLGLAALLVVD